MPEDDVEDFLSLATDLQVKGLAISEEDNPKSESEQKKPKKVEGKHRKRTPSEKHKTLENTESKEKVKIEIKPQTSGETSQQDVFPSQAKPIISKLTEDGKVKVNLKERNQALENTIDSMLKPEGSLWACSACGKTGAIKWVLRNHIETHIEGFVHMCPHCEKKFRTSNALQFHVFTLHKKSSSSEQ